MATLSPSLTILIVDDSPFARKLVETTLPPDQYKLVTAGTGREALQLFAKHQPSLVITDWLMPDLSGIELCQQIRTEFYQSYTYIILLTSVSEKSEVVKGLHAGADDYLTKPFHPEELLARVGVGKRMIELHREIESKNRQLEELARTDGLTGLPNRRAVFDFGSRQLSGAQRHGFPVWVVMADLDNFKAVNDTHGHDAGDAVLIQFAEILKASTRHCDMCARIGGEEFLLVVSFAELEGVHLAVDRLREQLAAERFKFAGREVSVTASFGIAGLAAGQPAEFGALLSKADQALYAAKRRGRNRVERATVEVV